MEGLRHIDGNGVSRDPHLMELRADDIEMILRLVAALGAGALIGYERSFHGRPAGLRTHVLVCLASALLMLVTVYEDHWVRTPGEVAPRSHAHGPGHHDGHRLPGRRRHRQGRPQRARPDHGRVDLDHRRHRRARGRRALSAHGGLGDPHARRVLRVPLDRDARAHAGLLQLRREVREGRQSVRRGHARADPEPQIQHRELQLPSRDAKVACSGTA